MNRLLFSSLMLLALPASAASGVISGRLLFFQNQGNYCPSTRDCSGAQYVEADYHTNQPVGDAKVFVRDQNDVVIGQGVTDANGDFTMSWYRSALPTSAEVFWTMAHKDDRFHFRSPTGGTYAYWTGALTLTHGTTAAAPQNVGTWITGSATTPSELANAYDGARMMWVNSLNKSGRMQNNFTGLDIRAFSDTVPSDCSTSCANGGLNRVQLDTAAAFRPQGRILHEMGHIASYKSNPRSRPANYCWPASSCEDGGWSRTSAEWKHASFEEGLATYLGDSAVYYWWAVDPRTCLSSGVCTGVESEVETSNGAPGGGTCGTNEGRAAISVWRYFWDIYDGQDDANFTEDLRRERYEIIDTLATFADGFGDHQKNEPYDSSWNVDALDGFTGYDFYWNYSVNHSSNSNSFSQLYNNCYPF